MKTLTATLLFVTGMVMHTWADPAKAKIPEIQIEISYKGVDAKWFSAIDQGTMSGLRKKGGTVVLPKVTGGVGRVATIEHVHEYRLKGSIIDDPVVTCGSIVNLSPRWNEGKMSLSGTAVLSYPTNKITEGVATRFRTQETLIGMKLDDGPTKTQAFDLEGGGQMLITVTLMDATGIPLKN